MDSRILGNYLLHGVMKMKKNIFIPILFLSVMMTACSGKTNAETTASQVETTVVESTTEVPIQRRLPHRLKLYRKKHMLKMIYNITEAEKKIQYIQMKFSISGLMRLQIITRWKAEIISLR